VAAVVVDFYPCGSGLMGVRVVSKKDSKVLGMEIEARPGKGSSLR
jgi:tRNA/tmRNA/rRNA uracil-C5-methylase (TrmA/RlmC/RlmD family)